MKRHLILLIATGLLPSSCDKVRPSKSNEAEAETGDFEDSAEEDVEADEPQAVGGTFSCKTTVQKSSPARAILDCELKEAKDHFELPSVPDPDTFRVLIDGVELPADAFKYDEVTGILEILKEVLAAQKVEISYDELETPDETPPAEAGLTTGTIVDLTGLDGCKFLIQIAAGKRLEPTNLPESFKKEGLEVTFKYAEVPEAASACMAGKIVTVSEMAEKAK